MRSGSGVWFRLQENDRLASQHGHAAIQADHSRVVSAGEADQMSIRDLPVTRDRIVRYTWVVDVAVVLGEKGVFGPADKNLQRGGGLTRCDGLVENLGVRRNAHEPGLSG